MKIEGNFNTIVVHVDEIEESAYNQLLELANNEHYKDFKIRVMPDCYAGKNCTIGTTLLGNKNIPINPELVGVDIGCGVLVCQINPLYKDRFIKEKLFKIDSFLRDGVGAKVSKIKHKTTLDVTSQCIEELQQLKIWNIIEKKQYICDQLGTLGSGNHFIEIDHSKGDFALIIHCGSRFLGQIVENHYEKLFNIDPNNETLWYQDYLHDIEITQYYAKCNRSAIANEILTELDITPYSYIENIHNYIEVRDDVQIIRKGAIAAYDNDYVTIPFNMQYGTLVTSAKSDENWNYSLPHGAGRVMSRSKAFKNVNLDEFEQIMRNIVSTSVNKNIMDEAPQVYKNPEIILNAIENQIVSIHNRFYKPLYIFKV